LDTLIYFLKEEQMVKKPLILAVIVLILLAIVPMAVAITFGQPDGNGHPNVGAMIVQEPDGVKYLYCSGTLIAPDVFLTAAHCTAAAAAYGADPHDAYVTFDPFGIRAPPCTVARTTSTPTTAMTCMICTI
jgi:hypothetical protein